MAVLPAPGPEPLVSFLTREQLGRYWGLLSLGAFFGAKVLGGLALLKLSAEVLPVADFALFSQFLMLWALLNLVAAGVSRMA